MAYRVNSIGAFSFIFLRGEAVGVRNMVELIARPNVAAISSRIFAAKGSPFTVVSLASAASESAAQALYQSYQTTLASGLLTVIKDDVNFTTSYSVSHKVLGVDIGDITAAAVLAGNVGSGHSYLLSCQWHLVAVGV